MPDLTETAWEEFISHYPNAHLLQTSAWGNLKASFGWKVVRVSTGFNEDPVMAAGAQVLLRSLPLGFSIAYIPKGPVGDNWEALWPEVDRICHKARAIFLKVEPDRWRATKQEGEEESIHPPTGFRLSSHSIQPPRSLIVDLSGSEELVLGNMKQKTRYNIKLAQKKGVIVHSSTDIEAFYRLMKVTGQRDQFGVHSLSYYQRTYELFQTRSDCELLLAEYQGELLAGLMVFAHGKRAWYLYGASTNDHRDRMPTYLLQWEAMRWARGHGCVEYDLWGVPDANEETLEAYFTQRNEGLWGVYRFKRGFGGHLVRASGPFDRIYQPLLYKLYQAWSGFRGSE
jgi:peptidoglycan pentaglycine glycine transferase (the first glycine)